jgi:eukaryotic-like serine/threonine-protein kinase
MLIGKERMPQEIWFQKYLIIRLLGSGGTARVYLAKHIKLNSYRAIKCISKTHPLYELQRNEALILKNLKHSCIPIIYDIEEDEEGSYIIEQYLEGNTLKDFVSNQGPLREDIIVSYAIQLCDLLHYLHTNERQLLYVDLKPDNILVSDQSLKLIDFGSAIYQDELLNKQGVTATRGYAAPELYTQGELDDRCDVYGIGMLLYFMATGILIAPNTKQISNIDQISICSKELKHIINHCLRFKPALRYRTVAQLKKNLSALMPEVVVGKESGQEQTIAVAGTRSGIGVTHLSFRLCNFMKSLGMECLYKEDNQSRSIKRMVSRLALTQAASGIYILGGIPILSDGQADGYDMAAATNTVIDLGTLTKDNLKVFLEADIRLLVVGAKEWELAYSEEVLNLITEYKDIIYLFNFLDGKQFRMANKNMERRCCYRIPYEPDPFRRITTQNGSEFFRMLIGTERNLRKIVLWQQRKRKGHRIHDKA